MKGSGLPPSPPEKHAPGINYFFWAPAFAYLVWRQCLHWDWFEWLTDTQKVLVLALGAVNLCLIFIPLMLLDGLIHAKARRAFLHWLWYMALAAVVLLFHADVLLFRRLGVHFTTALRLLTENGYQQSLIFVQSTGLHPGSISSSLLDIFFLLTAGACLVILARVLSERFAIAIKPVRLIPVLVIAFLCAITLDVWAAFSEQVRRVRHEQKRVLPATFALNQFQVGTRLNGARLPPPKSSGHAARLSTEFKPSTAPLPDVYFFVVESLRRDYVNPEVAPHLSRFAADCLPFGDSMANGNATHLGWFSLLRAEHPLYFGMVERNRGLWGSPPLRLLKERGYRIEVLSSSDLRYKLVDRILFGSDLELADSVVYANGFSNMPRPVRDQNTVNGLIAKTQTSAGGRLFLVFLESTHHDYFWPDSYPAPFQPIAEPWNYFLDYNISNDELTKIKNRYKNSVHFVDSLIGSFIDSLKTTGRYESSIVLVTGDHGEEFLEHQKLAHASEVCRAQTAVPILLKLPDTVMKGITAGQFDQVRATHVDCLPTILEVAGYRGPAAWNGESLLTKRDGFALVADDNGSRDPYEFAVYGNGYKAWFRYKSMATRIELENTIYLQRITDALDAAIEVQSSGSSEISLLKTNLEDSIKKIFPDIVL